MNFVFRNQVGFWPVDISMNCRCLPRLQWLQTQSIFPGRSVLTPLTLVGVGPRNLFSPKHCEDAELSLLRKVWAWLGLLWPDSPCWAPWQALQTKSPSPYLFCVLSCIFEIFQGKVFCVYLYLSQNLVLMYSNEYMKALDNFSMTTLANFFCNGSASKFLRLFGPWSLLGLFSLQ